MIEWTLPDMTCSHCAATVTRTLHEVDPEARVEIDLPSRRVVVQTAADPGPLAEALTRAGYTPGPLAAR